MGPYNIADAKTHLSEILEHVIQGEEVLLMRRGKPVARVVPVALASHNILGAGAHDPNINREVLDQDDWWKGLARDEERAWFE